VAYLPGDGVTPAEYAGVNRVDGAPGRFLLRAGVFWHNHNFRKTIRCDMIAGVSDRSRPPYRVGLNAHLLSLTQNYRGAGINGYINGLLRHLPSAVERGTAGDMALHYTAFLYEPAFSAPPGLVVSRSGWNTRRPWRRIVWEQLRLAGLSRGLDLLHGLAFATPVAARCATVVTVHDLSFLRHPEAFRFWNRYYLAQVTRFSVRHAARVIAVSESTRQDVISLCGAPAEKVVAIPNGVDDTFRPSAPRVIADFKRRHGLPDRYILFVGTLEPRKNLVRLVEAYAAVRNAPGSRQQESALCIGVAGPGAPISSKVPSLVIGGGKGWFYEEVLSRVNALGLADDVLFPGFIPAEELPRWYQGAELFVYPSLMEGFGLPVLEAMACGTPVTTSSASSLPEVAGDAAWLVDPTDTGELASSMMAILRDKILAARMRDAGIRQAARFTWGQTASATVEVYRETLNMIGRGGGST
jgi:glycosyltransferase involved in cell wall biosynthesis